MNPDQFKHLDTRLDRIEQKLDDHLHRLTKGEAAIEWLKGHAKLSTMILLSTVGYLLTQLFQLIGAK